MRKLTLAVPALALAACAQSPEAALYELGGWQRATRLADEFLAALEAAE